MGSLRPLTLYLSTASVPVLLYSLCFSPQSDPARRSVPSAVNGSLLILRTRTAGDGRRSFAVSGPRCWNGLPSALKLPSLLNTSVLLPVRQCCFVMATHERNCHKLKNCADINAYLLTRGLRSAIKPISCPSRTEPLKAFWCILK